MVTEVRVSTATAVAKVYTAGTIVYSTDFESGLDSWAAVAPAGGGLLTGYSVYGYEGGGAGGTSSPGRTHRGVSVINLNQPSAGSARTRRTVTGLTIGRVYRLTAWVFNAGTPVGTAYVGVAGIGTSSPIATSATAWILHSYEFTATATSHQLELWSTVYPSEVYWDTVTLTELPRVTATVTLDVESVRVTLDERRTPYASATVTVHRPVKADLDLLDPHANVRVELSLGITWLQPTTTAQSRTFDLYLHARNTRHSPGTVELTLQSDEAKLLDAGNATTTASTTGDLDQASLRRIVQTKLDTYKALLAAGTDDADETVVFAGTNLILNPSFEASVNGAAASTGASAQASVAVPTLGALFGTKALRWTAAAGDSIITFINPSGAAYTATPGETYTFSFYAASSVARNCFARIRFTDAAGTITDTSSAIVATNAVATGTWTRYSVTAIAPEGTVSVQGSIYTQGNAAGNQHYADGAMLTTGSTVLRYIDGAQATDAYYVYAWTGSANASTSTRTPLSSRNKTALWQDPGKKDWDWLLPLIQTAALRLFCDEQRVWRLVNPASYTVAGTITLTDSTNVTDADDTISREDGGWCDAVVIKYSWTDSAGKSQIAYDAASSGGTQLRTIEINRPYPGAGAAAALLARYSGLGRVQSLEAIINLNATPGMAAATTLPETPDQIGVVSKVDLIYAEQQISMTVTPRDLVNA